MVELLCVCLVTSYQMLYCSITVTLVYKWCVFVLLDVNTSTMYLKLSYFSGTVILAILVRRLVIAKFNTH